MDSQSQTTSLQRLQNVEKDIQMTLRDEIKSACEYRPFENYGIGVPCVCSFSFNEESITRGLQR
ncbi:hypothetical protein QYF36_008291 [Acer negundo]|nr:hypothetical protein QYF36_008291 [Acer negundo]